MAHKITLPRAIQVRRAAPDEIGPYTWWCPYCQDRGPFAYKEEETAIWDGNAHIARWHPKWRTE